MQTAIIPTQLVIPTQDALQRVYGTASPCLQSQARIALSALVQASGDIPTMVEGWLFDDEVSPATVRKRLNCLSRLGVDVAGHRPKLDKAPKWWLTPSAQRDLMAHGFVPQHIKLYVRWATMTGLRVEESLRLTPSMLVGDGLVPDRVAIPGTKTALAAATLPLSREAGEVVLEAMRLSGGNPWPWHYDTLRDYWELCREVVGAIGVPTATLKALRRNAARYLHVDRGMPIDMVRQYLRHSNIETTMGYLKLTGGYGEHEMRRYL